MVGAPTKFNFLSILISPTAKFIYGARTALSARTNRSRRGQGCPRSVSPLESVTPFRYNHSMKVDSKKLTQQFKTFLHKKPALGNGVYIAKGAVVLGDVTMGDHSSIWYNAVAR